jgi:acyl carrier protein
MMKISEFLRELELLFSEKKGSLKEDRELKYIANLDSVGMLGLVTFLSNDIGMEVDIDALRNAKTIQDIIVMTDGRVA